MSTIKKVDRKIIDSCRKYAVPVARISLFIIFFWFGFLKVLLMSPAAGLVAALQVQILPFLEPTTFVVILGLGEMLIGILFLFPKLTRAAILILVLHMFTTILPLFFLPEIAWQAFLVPTLEGQYIIKNVALVALALQVGISLQPMDECEIPAKKV